MSKRQVDVCLGLAHGGYIGMGVWACRTERRIKTRVIKEQS